MNTELKQGISLGVGAAIAILVIATTYHATRDTIKATAQRQLETNLIQLLEPESYDNQPATDIIHWSDIALGTEKPRTIYRARNKGKPTGVVVSALAPNGYNGDIDLLIGLNYAGDIIGVRVTAHKETPGLGDDIDISRSDWIRGFDQLTTSHMQNSEWQVKKEGGRFDQFTGATITPRAVVHAVQRVANWYLAERSGIFERIKHE